MATKHHRSIGDEDDDITRWDETIFERCLRVGFNPFGSGPTPVFLRHEPMEETAADHLPEQASGDGRDE
ncbi:MAG: hypothetical protein DI527_22220 [Chelatococcus sp.]|uniref:hypothetical protein n=1 Tax=Bosea sp. TND4EK4 TaxID=1907408 RepID=UPI000DB7B504|nr:hypothetical protein [Bosea sp. TND4EK4]PZU84743.1 MAG: hypothetical protein DI527_22220 [Chelatococcus sp.]